MNAEDEIDLRRILRLVPMPDSEHDALRKYHAKSPDRYHAIVSEVRAPMPGELVALRLLEEPRRPSAATEEKD